MIDRSKVLVIDDEISIRSLLRATLEANGFQVDEAKNGSDGLTKAIEVSPHVIILDLGLPDMNGLQVLKQLRTWTSIPILVLTVKDDEETKVNLLDSGADDFLTKPFGNQELLARIRVSLRHQTQTTGSPVFSSGSLSVDLNSRSVRKSGQNVKLTSTEYELLRRLVRSSGRVVPQSLLLTEIWGPNAAEQTHYLRIYIGQLRKKLEENPSMPAHIITELGVGYRIV